MLKALWLRLERAILGRDRSDLLWWQRRARRRGARAVVNLQHHNVAEITAYQKSVLYPLFNAERRGDERSILDFGCGTGRFTPDLADLTGAHVVGVDPIAQLIALAPSHPNVEYRLLKRGTIPAADHEFDIVWICLVLIGITDEHALTRAIAEIRRVLRPGGLVFLVENTHQRGNLPHHIYRPIEFYTRAFPSIPLRHESNYYDLGERISVFVGRKL